jgi:thiol-disulfide isomerase/thioredoxin
MFKIGTILTGKHNNSYAITNSNSLCMVIGNSTFSSDGNPEQFADDEALLLVVARKNTEKEIGEIYPVCTSDFDVVPLNIYDCIEHRADYNFIDKDPVSTQGTQVGQRCPELSLAYLDGEGTYAPQQTAGKVTILNFWGTWCTPCVTELLQEFPQITAEYGDAVAVVTIHSNYEQATAPDPETFVAENFSQFGYIFCQDGEGESCYNLFGDGQTWPCTVILDEEGVIVSIIVGSTTAQELRTIIDGILMQ